MSGFYGLCPVCKKGQCDNYQRCQETLDIWVELAQGYNVIRKKSDGSLHMATKDIYSCQVTDNRTGEVINKSMLKLANGSLVFAEEYEARYTQGEAAKGH